MELYSEHDSVLHNSLQPSKRDTDVAENSVDDDKKSKRKRRSSLASTRRSITGNVMKPDYNSDLPSSCSSSSSSSQSQSQPQDENQKKGSEFNPVNIRMGEIIGQFEDNISRLNQECSEWKLSLKNMEKEQEHTKLLSECNTPISPEDIPQELRDLAQTEYMCDLIDFGAIARHVEKGLLKSYFDVHKCLQDMKLMRGAVSSIKTHNQYLKASFTQVQVEDKDDDDFDDDDDDDVMDTAERRVDGGRGLLTGVKDQLQWLMNN